MLLLLVEIVLLPGVSVAGIGAIISYAIAVYKAFIEYDSEGGWLVQREHLAAFLAQRQYRLPLADPSRGAEHRAWRTRHCYHPPCTVG